MGTVRLDIDKLMTIGTGFFLIGGVWLIFWFGPAFSLFESDQRWGHNFVIPIVFMTVGLAYNSRALTCQFTAMLASFLVIIPTLLGLWSWKIALLVANSFFIIACLLYFVDRTIGEVFHPDQRLKAWLNIHLLNFSYIALLHIPLIFFISRWFNQDLFSNNLPVENYIPTIIFNAMLFVLAPLAMMERYTKEIAGIELSKAGFVWSVLMIVIPLLVINFFE